MRSILKPFVLLAPLLILGILFAVGGVGIAAKDQEARTANAIKALLVTGGGYHDYKTQKKILTEGISKRAEVEWDVFMGDAKQTKEKLSEEGWADDYDVIVYNLCHAHETDGKFVEGLGKVHHEGKAAVVIHCAMHSYHWKIPGETKH